MAKTSLVAGLAKVQAATFRWTPEFLRIGPRQPRLSNGLALKLLLASGCWAACAGCQLTKPPHAFNPASMASHAPSSNFKPPSDGSAAARAIAASYSQTSSPTSGKSPSGQSAPASQPSTSAASARIRGQSPLDGTEPAYSGATSIGNNGVVRSALPPLDLPTQPSVTEEIPAPLPFRSSPPGREPLGQYPAGEYSSSPSDYNSYNSAIAPGAMGSPNSFGSAIAPGAIPGYEPADSAFPDTSAPSGVDYRPRQRVSPIDVYVQEARTGSITLGGTVNSDLGVSGQLIINERNFDIRRPPKSWNELWSGRAFRGGGQNFRAELMPGSQVQRYTVNWTESNLLGYMPYSLSVGGFYYTRQFRDWTEQRLGGRVALGYAVTHDVSISSELRMEDVNISQPRISGVQDLDSALGSNDIYTARFRVARDTRDNPFMSTEGSFLELIFDQVFGEYDFSRGNLNYSRYFRIHERPDGGGRHTLASTWKFGVTGSQTPIFENFFAGGYSTLRGFSFRGASPKVNDVQVGGEFMFLGSLEYVFPITADDMLRGVAFVDYGTIEQDLTIDSGNFRVAPGLGLRIAVPALGPAPLAFDFAYPINHADTDDRQVFSFFMGLTRN